MNELHPYQKYIEITGAKKPVINTGFFVRNIGAQGRNALI